MEAFNLATLIILTFGVLTYAARGPPEFLEPRLHNVTVALGQNITFTCRVFHLGGYRVAWVRSDTKQILAIHTHVITQLTRVSVSHDGQTDWNLHIQNVQLEDAGPLMCQINTDPMKNQVGHLHVVIPPEIIDAESSHDVMVLEGGSVKLVCKAKGLPAPTVHWHREDGQDIIIREFSGERRKIATYDGEVLKLSKVSRTDMTGYICTGNNGVPPSATKRIFLGIPFHPDIRVPNQLIGAIKGTNVTAECFVEAYPRSINYWVRDDGELIVLGDKFSIVEMRDSHFSVHMILTIKNVEASDYGKYRCVVKNSIGDVDSTIRIYEIIDNRPTTTVASRIAYMDYPDYSDPAISSQEMDANEIYAAENEKEALSSDNLNKFDTFNTIPAFVSSTAKLSAFVAGSLIPAAITACLAVQFLVTRINYASFL